LLVELAELLGCAMTEVQRDYNRPELCIPTRHPLNVTGTSWPEPADVVLALEVRDLAVIPGADDAEVLQVSTAGLAPHAWAAGLPAAGGAEVLRGTTAGPAPKAWAADLRGVQPAGVLVAADVRATREALAAALRAGRRPDRDARACRSAAHTAGARAGWAERA